MTVTANDLAKNSFAISIDESKYNLLVKIFNASKLGFVPAMFNGCTDPKLKPFLRCTRAHVNLINKAKQLDLPYVLVFEDDAYPCIECAKKLNAYMQNIPTDAKLILFGWSNSLKNSQKFDKQFNRITTNSLCGSHAYILFKSGYDEYLNYFNLHKDGKADNNIFYAMNGYVIDKPLFIQYSKTRSVINNHTGYIFYGDHKTPPAGFVSLEKMLSE